MKTRALFLALPVLALVSGCRDNRASVQIQAICAGTKTCVVQQQVRRRRARYAEDRSRPSRTYLTLILQLENQTPDNSDEDLKRTNTNDAHVDEAVIEYSGALSGRTVFGAAGQVPANSTQVVSVDIIPASVGASRIAPLGPPAFPQFVEALAKLRLRGYFDDGTRFETGEFPVTIEIMHRRRDDLRRSVPARRSVARDVPVAAPCVAASR